MSKNKGAVVLSMWGRVCYALWLQETGTIARQQKLYKVVRGGEWSQTTANEKRDLPSFLTHSVLYIKTGSGIVQPVRLHELTHFVVCQGQEDSDPELCMLYSFTAK